MPPLRAGHHGQTLLPCHFPKFHHLARAHGIHRHRFFNEHVLASVEGGFEMSRTERRRRRQQHDINRQGHQLAIARGTSEHAVRRNVVFLGRAIGAVREKIGHRIDFHVHSQLLGGFEVIFHRAIAPSAATHQTNLEFSAGVLRADIEQWERRNHRAGGNDVFDKFTTGYVQ